MQRSKRKEKGDSSLAPSEGEGLGKNMIRIILLLLLFLTICTPSASEDLSIKGQIAPQVMVNKDGDYIRLPHRLLNLELGLSRDEISMNSVFDLEYSSKDNSVSPGLRESFIDYTHSFGDLYLGKQIITWGSADANNPTDNINPYDYYYLMNEGADRRIGNLMAREEIYIKDFTFTLVLTPFFTPARLPDEDDFPIFKRPQSISMQTPMLGKVDVPLGDETSTPKAELHNSEGGIRGRLALSQIEIAASYFEGFDRQPSPVFGFPSMQTPYFDYWTYYRTKVIGLELIGLYSNFALRTEGAYFLTEDTEGEEPFIRNPYFQYVAQLDWNGPEQTMVILQYMGMKSTKIDDDAEEKAEDNLPVGMGTIFCSLARSGIMGIVKKDIGDAPHRLEMRALYDMDKKGYMIGGSFSFSPVDAFYVKLGVNYFDGDEESAFNTMNSFSHVLLQGKYSF